MKVLLRFNKNKLAHIGLDTSNGKDFTAQTRLEFGCEIGNVSGAFLPSGKSLDLDFKLISDRPITYKAFLRLPDGTFNCKVVIFRNNSKRKPSAAIVECIYKAGRS